ncbi:PCNA-interacting partner-like [Clytia hemisphaerica]|uniref:PCNA-interacting partner n=1 Tax=Clytia hemisphaerica TaxID=252671 RepID=A0A7M5V8T0_9CNID
MNKNLKVEILKTFRELFDGRFIEHRSTFLSDVDQLAAIQLALLLLQKKLHIQGDITPLDLFNIQHKIIKQKQQESEENLHASSLTQEPITKDGILKIVTFDEVYEAYNEFLTQCNMIDQQDVMKFIRVHAKDDSENQTKPRCLKLLQKIEKQDLSSPALSQSPSRPALLQLRRVILSYLQLLVNSRDEIALARVIDIPTRGITHKAFTDIRQLAKQKDAPMFQTVASFVRMLLLGGKGYVPDEHHILYEHREGLGEFVELMDKLQTAIDEEHDIKSAIFSIFKILKCALIRAKIPTFSTNIVGAGFSQLLQKTKSFLGEQVDKSCSDKTLQLRGFLDYLACVWGNDISLNSSQLCGVLSTPQVNEKEQMKKISSLLTQFSTPKCDNDTPIKPKSQKRFHNNSPIQQHLQKERKTTIQDVQDLNSSPEELAKPIKLIRVPNEIKSISPERKSEAETIRETSEPPEKKPKSRLNLESRLTDKENNKTMKKVKKTSTKPRQKVSKKCALLPGQKTLNQFFKS